jgi:hypothetical protein
MTLEEDEGRQKMGPGPVAVWQRRCLQCAPSPSCISYGTTTWCGPLNRITVKKAKLPRVLYPCNNQANSHSGNSCAVSRIWLEKCCAYIISSDLHGCVFQLPAIGQILGACGMSCGVPTYHVMFFRGSVWLAGLFLATFFRPTWLNGYARQDKWISSVSRCQLSRAFCFFSIGNSAMDHGIDWVASVIIWHRRHKSSHQTRS